MQASAGFLDPKTKTNASKIVRFLESYTANISDAGGGGCDSDLAATASSIGQLSLTTTAAGRADFNMLTKELQATSQTVTGNMQSLIEHYRRGGQGIVMTGSNLMSLCLCALGPSDLSSGDIFNSQEIISMMKTLLMMRPHFPITYCVSLPLPGVLGQETVKSLNGKGRPVEWMPSFMCLHPIACKAPSSWRMPSASFDFRCDHVPSHSGRTFCTQCKQASRPRCMVFFSLSKKQVLLKPTSVWMLCRVVAYCCRLEFLSKIMAAPLSWHVVQASIRNGWSIARRTPAARLSLYYVAYSDAIHICCIRSSLPIFHSCFGAACAIFRFFQIFTRNFQGTHFHHLSRCSITTLQLLPKSQPKRYGRCIAENACLSAAMNAASCWPLTMALSLPHYEHARLARLHATAAQSARLLIGPATKLHVLLSNALDIIDK